jgi:hypothetical protein
MATETNTTRADRIRDAVALESLARRLQALAARLRRAPDLPANKVPCSDEEAAEIATKIPRLRAILYGEGNGPRETLIGLCRAVGDLMRHGHDVTEGDVDMNVTRIVATYAGRVPEDRARIRSAAVRDRLRALVVAEIANKGGRGNQTAEVVKQAAEGLCKVMGYPASADTILRTRKRRVARRKG